MDDLQLRVPTFVESPADHLVAQFFDITGPFAATTFDALPDNPHDRFTAADLLAVTLLDVALPPSSVRRLLETESAMFGELLAAIPTDVDLWDATDDVMNRAAALYWALRKLHKVGRTRASKLMARKRPRLIPVIDSVIRDALELGDDSWAQLRHCLGDSSVRQSIEAIRPARVSVEEISTLRLLDAAVWMRSSRSTYARYARRKAGLH